MTCAIGQHDLIVLEACHFAFGGDLHSTRGQGIEQHVEQGGAMDGIAALVTERGITHVENGTITGLSI